SIGLPVPPSDSPQSVPAYNFQQIVTASGTFTYDEMAKNYTYKSHAQFAAEAQAKEDAASQAFYQQQWDRRVQEYQLGTSRLGAVTPQYSAPSTYWWWRR